MRIPNGAIEQTLSWTATAGRQDNEPAPGRIEDIDVPSVAMTATSRYRTSHMRRTAAWRKRPVRSCR